MIMSLRSVGALRGVAKQGLDPLRFRVLVEALLYVEPDHHLGVVFQVLAYPLEGRALPGFRGSEDGPPAPPPDSMSSCGEPMAPALNIVSSASTVKYLSTALDFYAYRPVALKENTPGQRRHPLCSGLACGGWDSGNPGPCSSVYRRRLFMGKGATPVDSGLFMSEFSWKPAATHD